MASRQMNIEVLKGALENATDAIGMSTPEGRHFYQNRAFTELFGNIGENPPATLYCSEQIGQEVFRTIKRGDTWTGEVEMFSREGNTLRILLRAYAITDPKGHVAGLVGIHTDITERMRAEEALQVSEATYREIFNSVNDVIWIHDIDTFEFIDVNDTVTKMFGYSVEESLALTVEDISSGIPPYTLDTAANLMQKAAAGEAQLFEWQTKHKDGHLFWTEVSLKRGTIADRACLLAIERDITERKRTMEALKRTHVLEGLGTVAGGIAHDFNNMLMGVFGNIELAQLKLPLDHEAYVPLQSALLALESTRHLTTRLLTFAKGGNPVLGSVDLREHLSENVLFHLAGGNVAAHFDISADLWCVKADKGQLTEVISNLTINAKEAMPAGGNLYVCVRNLSGKRDASVELTFRDEGVGIPANLIDRIADPYFTTKQAGSGLGLAIVHGIVQRHGGQIHVESEPGVGTTISVLLPATLSPSSTVAPSLRDEPPLVSKRILLVDDEKVILDTTSQMLKELGCTVEVALNGKEAIEAHAAALNRGRPFDLTIMDLTIPGGMGGGEAITDLLALDPSAKVIVSSGYSSSPIIANHRVYGFSGRLVKPYRLKELAKVISEVLDQQ